MLRTPAPRWAPGQSNAEGEATRDLAVEAVLNGLRDTSLFWRAKQALKEELLKPQYEAAGLPGVLGKVLRSSPLGAELKDFAYERLRQLRRRQRQVECLAGPPGMPLPPLPASVDVEDSSTHGLVEWARWRWATLLLKRLRELSREQQQPFLRPRARAKAAQRGEGTPGSARGAACDPAEVCTGHIIELDRLYRLLTSELRARSRCAGGTGLLARGLWWGALGMHLRTEALQDLRARYQDLSADRPHLGVIPDARRSPAEAELSERHRVEGLALLTRPYAPQLQAYARLGVPPSLRQEVWMQCLGVEARNSCVDLQEVARGVCDWEWITDDVLRLDVAEHCVNDVSYFPFDEIVESLVLALSRDTSLSADCEVGPPQVPLLAGAASLPAGAEAAGAGAEQQLVPPCGVVPFRSFSNYACPFAFLADRLEIAYPLFRGFYCRHLSRLHTISCKPGTLLPLCALFESLVSTTAPHVGYHLAHLGPEAAPLRFAFPWIVSGFVGFLRADQVLWLWDRVLGFDSVELIAILAAAILAFRARLVLSAKTPEDVEFIFSDISSLQAVPLLQGFLFAAELSGPPKE